MIITQVVWEEDVGLEVVRDIEEKVGAEVETGGGRAGVVIEGEVGAEREKERREVEAGREAVPRARRRSLRLKPR